MTTTPLPTAFATRGFELADWQQDAVDAWMHGDADGPHRGTLEIFTGGGKTLIALAAVERIATDVPDLRLAVVVPTQALARQWRDFLRRHTSLDQSEVGILGARRRDTFDGHRVLIAVLASAAKRLPELAAEAQPMMLVVDECHRAGAPVMSRVLQSAAPYRLGLSATPEREELDESGEPIDYDDHILGRDLGRVVYRFSLRDARQSGWLPHYEISHHAIQLMPIERGRYEDLSRQVEDVADRLEASGVPTLEARKASAREGAIGQLAKRYVTLTSERKDLLYRARERNRVASQLVHDTFERRGRPRVLIFHERVAEAKELFDELRRTLPGGSVVLEHSRLGARAREAALESFRTGASPVLVSVKSLIEGVDVPEADVGISVASTSSVRQRIQSLGRVLRRRSDAENKSAEMHVVYVDDSVDEVIYGKEDWSDLTGTDANRYWRWPLGGDQPELLAGPPRTPRATEDQEWDRIGRQAPEQPVPYFGEYPSRDYSVDTRGTVTNAAGSIIANPQGVGEMIQRVRRKPGGRFYITPKHHMVLVVDPADPDRNLHIAGVLFEPFTTRDVQVLSALTESELAQLSPGDPYPGPVDKSRGEFWMAQRGGGTVERRVGRTREFAFTDRTAANKLAENALRAIESWRTLKTTGLKFSVNKLGHAWFLDRGEPKFLADVPGGFAFPGRAAEGSDGGVDTAAAVQR